MSDLLICVDRNNFPAEIVHPFYLPEDSPVVLCGSPLILKKPRLTILNSRQSPRLTRNSTWAQKTLEALRALDHQNDVIVSSLGTTTWDFLTWAAARMGFGIVLVYPAGSAQGFSLSRTKAIVDLGLSESKTLALRPLRLGRQKTQAEDQAVRDGWILAMSDTILPISIRPRGNFERHLHHKELSAEAVTSEYRIAYDPPKPLKRPQVTTSTQIPSWYHPEEYLIHWTRSCIGPWPGESRADYFSRVMQGEHDRGGLETLERILAEGVIRAAGRLIRGGYEVVPFTERPPQDVADLMRWRSGLRRWTFEAYGIALLRSKLIELGARPVAYGEIGQFERLAEVDKPFFQVSQTAAGVWQEEKEWRLIGDLTFHGFNVDEVALFAPSQKEADRLAKNSSFRTIALSMAAS